MVSVMAKGYILGLIAASEVFLFFLPDYTNFIVFIFVFASFSDEIKYSFLNIPKQQYIILLTFHQSKKTLNLKQSTAFIVSPLCNIMKVIFTKYIFLRIFDKRE